MVFTIVTIIFLPLSFIAAIFTINIREFPHEDGGSEPSLPLSYVSKYMFGIGFAISIPLVALAFSVDAVGDFFRKMQRRILDRGSKKSPASRYNGGASHDKLVPGSSAEHIINMHALEQALSTGRSMQGRRSYDTHASYNGPFGVPLYPVTSRGTARTVIPNGNGSVRGKVEVEVRPLPVERQSTGFKIRRSMDV